MVERRIRISQQTSFSRHAKVLQGKLSLVQAAWLANQLGGRGRPSGWLAARLVGLLVGWHGGLVVLTSLSLRQSLFSYLGTPLSLSFSLSFFLFLSLSLSVSVPFVLALLSISSSTSPPGLAFNSFSSFLVACLPSLFPPGRRPSRVAEPKKRPCKLPPRTMATRPTPRRFLFPRRNGRSKQAAATRSPSSSSSFSSSTS